MNYEDDMEYESEDEEMLDMEKETLEKLRAKEYTVLNKDGKTLRCPLSPSRKKQAYAFKDLLQHATAVASGKRGPEAAGKHSGLKKYLEADLSSLSTPPVERFLKVEQTLPRRRQAEDMLVCPWSVVIYNIDNRRRDLNKPGIRVGPGKNELKPYFEEFHPVQLEVCWGPQGHLGMCVLHFGRDLAGFRDAQALEHSFLKKDHGLRDYERNVASGNLGKEFYAWLAREDDFRGHRRGSQGEYIGRHLRKIGNLKDIEMFGDETRRMHDQQVQQLAATVSKKSQEFQDLRTEMESKRLTAEQEKARLEEAHKRELEGLRDKARISEQQYNQATLDNNRALADKENELRQLDKQLREKESNLTSAEEKDELQAQLDKSKQLRDQIVNQKVLLQQTQLAKIKLLQKHEEETRLLTERAQKEALSLAMRQHTELEREDLQSLLSTEKLFDKLTISHEGKPEGNRVEELQEQLKELEENKEDNEELINSLMVKERISNDELVDARKRAVTVLRMVDKAKLIIEPALVRKSELDERRKKPPPPQPRVALRFAGGIDDASWPRAFQKKYEDDDEWGVEMTKTLSSWEALIKNPDFNPFKNVNVGNDKWKKEIDESDVQLASLKEEFGEEVYNSVTTALMEIEEYNASGRYPIFVPWFPKESRKASMEEAVAHFGEVIGALLLPPPIAARKKSRN